MCVWGGLLGAWVSGRGRAARLVIAEAVWHRGGGGLVGLFQFGGCVDVDKVICRGTSVCDGYAHLHHPRPHPSPPSLLAHAACRYGPLRLTPAHLQWPIIAPTLRAWRGPSQMANPGVGGEPLHVRPGVNGENVHGGTGRGSLEPLRETSWAPAHLGTSIRDGVSNIGQVGFSAEQFVRVAHGCAGTMGSNCRAPVLANGKLCNGVQCKQL